MDVYCPRCGEPWDTECLHEEAQERYGQPFWNDRETLAGIYVPIGQRTKNPAWSSDEYQTLYAEVRQEFQQKGCGAFQIIGSGPCEPRPSSRGAAARVLMELAGDDLDGLAADLADAEAAGLL